MAKCGDAGTALLFVVMPTPQQDTCRFAGSWSDCIACRGGTDSAVAAPRDAATRAFGRKTCTESGAPSAESANGPYLVALTRAVAAAARETVQARRAADAVKEDTNGPEAVPASAGDKEKAAAKLEARAGLDGLFAVDAGPYAAEARAIGLLTALDRMEIARGLPKHLKIFALRAPYADVFRVEAPSVSPVPAAPILSGTWLTYLTQVAAAAGHPVPEDARDPQNREALAWTSVLEGFADRLRAGAVHESEAAELARVEQGVSTRLDDEFAGEREHYQAHAAKDR